VKELDLSNVFVDGGARRPPILCDQDVDWLPEKKMLLAVSTCAFFVALLWAYFPATSRALGNFCLEELLEGLPDILSDPEGLLPCVLFVLVVWALAAVLRFAGTLIADILSGESRAGPRGLGLK
jgi:hypothetical protein